MRNHNVCYVQFHFNINLNMDYSVYVSNNYYYSRPKASPHELSNKSRVLNNNLSSILQLSNNFYKHAIDSLCHFIICS